MITVFDIVENISEKLQNNGYQHFLRHNASKSRFLQCHGKYMIVFKRIKQQNTCIGSEQLSEI